MVHSFLVCVKKVGIDYFVAVLYKYVSVLCVNNLLPLLHYIQWWFSLQSC